MNNAIASYYTADEAAVFERPRVCDHGDCGKVTGLTIWVRHRVIRCPRHPPPIAEESNEQPTTHPAVEP